LNCFGFFLFRHRSSVHLGQGMVATPALRF
jgi:hypothetical protein